MISAVAELLMELKKIPSRPHKHIRNWFRGQSKVGWQLRVLDVNFRNWQTLQRTTPFPAMSGFP